jgi:hypothetical protein
MYVPGVKCEHPPRKSESDKPDNQDLSIGMVIRDGNYTRLAKIEDGRPEDVVRILNSIFKKMNSDRRVYMQDKEMKQ